MENGITGVCQGKQNIFLKKFRWTGETYNFMGVPLFYNLRNLRVEGGKTRSQQHQEKNQENPTSLGEAAIL
jgi:hypothetical protein